jgi:hypothetical protein
MVTRRNAYCTVGLVYGVSDFRNRTAESSCKSRGGGLNVFGLGHLLPIPTIVCACVLVVLADVIVFTHDPNLTADKLVTMDGSIATPKPHQ